MSRFILAYPFVAMRALQASAVLLLIGVAGCIVAISAQGQTREAIAAAGETAKAVGAMDTAHLLALICVVLLGALCFVCWLNVRIGFRVAVDIAKIQTTQTDTLQAINKLRCSRAVVDER
jgi:hypothetical protein